ncbi:MAG: hypothetical protein ACR2NW_09630 [Thermodesulfobacteriota bacterium]
MLRKIYKVGVLLVFLIIPFLIISTVISASALEKTSIEFKLFRKAGVKIPIRDFEREESNILKFEIYKNDVSTKDYIWSSIWGKDFGYFMDGANLENKNKECPFVGEETKLPGSKIENIGDGKHLVTMVLPPEVIDSIITNKCAVSPKPRKSPKVDKIQQPEKTTEELFPIVR